MRSPHAGEPFTDDDAAIAAALEDVSVPALLCSLVHMTGAPSWIRGDIRPRVAVSLDIQSGMPPQQRAEAGRKSQSLVRQRHKHAAVLDAAILPAFAKAPAGCQLETHIPGIAGIAVLAVPPEADLRQCCVDLGRRRLD